MALERGRVGTAPEETGVGHVEAFRCLVLTLRWMGKFQRARFEFVMVPLALGCLRVWWQLKGLGRRIEASPRNDILQIKSLPQSVPAGPAKAEAGWDPS